jgi:MSHA biogenesis protein MshM
MYLEHFKLADRPFRLTPDLTYRFAESSHCDALATLLVALEQGEGFIKVTGEVGLGKTLLCRLLLERLQPPFLTAWLPDPHLSPGTLRLALARDFGISLPARPTQQEVHERLQAELTKMAAQGQRPVLIIDEAQALPDSTLETVRLLTNLETERRKLLQVALFAQPELDQRLSSHKFRQLLQRITFSCELRPLDVSGVQAYITHRLNAAGSSQTLFTRHAVRSIARASTGVPRLINILCDKALLAAYGRGKPRAGWFEVRRAIADTQSTRPALWWPRLQPAARMAAFGAVALGTVMFLGLMRGGAG